MVTGPPKHLDWVEHCCHSVCCCSRITVVPVVSGGVVEVNTDAALAAFAAPTLAILAAPVASVHLILVHVHSQSLTPVSATKPRNWARRGS